MGRGKTLVAILAAILAMNASGQSSQTFGQWQVIRSDDGQDFIAGTTNDQGSWLAFRCFTKTQNCLHAVTVGTECDDGHEYPMLISSEDHALAINGTCSVNGSSYELLLKPYDSISSLIKTGTQIGVVVPLQSGQFKVARFSGTGAATAIAEVERRTREAASDEGYL